MKIKSDTAVALGLVSFQSDNNTYMIFDARSKECHCAQIPDQSKEADVVLFGEQLDNPINHRLVQELPGNLYEDKKDKHVMEAEMFEADNQMDVNKYWSGSLTVITFRDLKNWIVFSRKLEDGFPRFPLPVTRV